MSFCVRAAAAACVVSVALIPAAALADDCKPLTIEASVDMATSDANRDRFVPVTIGTTAKLMLVDTGASYSFMGPDTVTELGLLPYHNFHFIEENVSGEESNMAVTVSPFSMGTLSAKAMEFAVWKGEFASKGSPIAGAVGANILANYDVDLDFGANKLNFISPDHCEGKVIYWPAAAVAVVPITLTKLGTILLPVSVEGHVVTALLDTGASRTTMMRTVAEGMGLTMGAPDTPKSGNLSDLPNATTYHHIFSSLALEGIAIGNVDVDIIPDMSGEKDDSEVGTHIFNRDPFGNHPDMLLGMDVLRHLHVYIAYHEQKLYITPASAPAPQATASSPAAPAASQAAH